MNTYIVAYINFFDNQLTQEIVDAHDEYSALKVLLVSKGIEPYEDLKTVEELKSLAFDCDSMVSAFKL